MLSRDDPEHRAHEAGWDGGGVPAEALKGGSRWLADASLLRWAPKVYMVVAVGLVPWVVYLALTLPRRATATHYRLAWVGFDCFLVLALARTSWLAYRRRPEAELTAVTTATLLIVDAWFDITTAPTTGDLVQAVLLATFAEIPAALASLYLVRRVDKIISAQLHVAAAATEPAAQHSPDASGDDAGVGIRMVAPGDIRLDIDHDDGPIRPAAPDGPVG